MSTDRLSELLEELAGQITPVDAVDTAWQGARATRARRRVAAAAGVAVAAVAVTIGVAVLDRDGPDAGPPVTTPSRTPTPTPDVTPAGPDRPDTTYAGIDIFWSPTAAEEADLPWYDGASPLPRTLDLGADAPEMPGEERVLAVFAVFGADSGSLTRVLLLLPDGTSRSLDVSRLEPVRDEAGNAAALMPNNGGLASDGRHVFFAQNSSLEVYEFATGSWTTIDTPDWQAERARWLDAETIWLPSGETFSVSGRPLGSSDVDWVFGELAEDALVYGPVKTTAGAVAQSQRLAGPVAGDLANPEAIGVTDGRDRSALAFAGLDRAKGCCPVVGWLDAGTVVFESAGSLLAWRVGTHEVTRVAELVGGPGIGSWASLTD